MPKEQKQKTAIKALFKEIAVVFGWSKGATSIVFLYSEQDTNTSIRYLDVKMINQRFNHIKP